MKLSVREAAKILSVSENQVYRWVDEGSIPFFRVKHQPSFSRAELLEWATERRLPVSVELFREQDEGVAAPSLVEALTRGGVHHHIGLAARDDALRAAIDDLPGIEESDRDLLLEILMARESLGSTAIGGGIAIPHVRSPVVFPGADGAIAVCFLDPPLDMNALDGLPVHTLFLIVSPTIGAHLQLLSEISLALHDPGFKAAVLRRADAAQILAEAERVEATFASREGTTAPSGASSR